MRILGSATVALRRIVDIGLVALIVIVLGGIVLGKGAPLVGRQSIVIGGGSMEPTLGVGTAIVVRPVAASDLAVGDIVSMKVGPEQTVYTHRILDVLNRADGRWIRTKGDANAVPDPTLVPATAVIGRVETVIPFAGYLLALLSLPMGIMFVLGLAATLLAVAWLLESLEPAPGPGRRDRLVPGLAGRPADGLSGASSAVARSAEQSLASPQPDGEPIAARPAPLTYTAESGWALAVPTAGRVADAGPRPSVRGQIERSREVRRRRALWSQGETRDRALD